MQHYQEILSTGKLSDEKELIEKYEASLAPPPTTQNQDDAESEFAAAHQEFLAGNGEIATTADEDNLAGNEDVAESEHDESIPDFVVDGGVAVKQEPPETMPASNEAVTKPELVPKIKQELPELSSSVEQNPFLQDTLSPFQGM